MDEDDSGEISADEFVCSTELQQMFVSSVKFWNSDVSVYIYIPRKSSLTILLPPLVVSRES